jgi:hypothetical protein
MEITRVNGWVTVRVISSNESTRGRAEGGSHAIQMHLAWVR